MIKDTNTKKENAQNRLQSLENSGFIRLFILIIIVVAILIYLGLDPKGVWENILKPIVVWGFNTTVSIIGFLFDIAIWFIEKIRNILSI